jgi:hypothetical protein
MKYKIVKEHNVYNIHELNTELVVFSSSCQFKVRKLLKSLNNRSGFDGFTPTFFCNKVTIDF